MGGWRGWKGVKGAGSIATNAKVNTAIPSQLETVNALDSVLCHDRSVQLMLAGVSLPGRPRKAEMVQMDMVSVQGQAGGSLIGQVGLIMEV
jgi:hypothetical protein